MAHVLSAAERSAFLAAPHVAMLSIEAATRAPLLVPVWYAWDGLEVGIWMAGDSRKARLLREAGRLSLCVQDTRRPYRYVSLEGRVLSSGPIDWTSQLVPLVQRYLEAAEAARYLTELGGPTGVGDDIYVRLAPVHWRAEQL
jgi:hypothetical protein